MHPVAREAHLTMRSFSLRLPPVIALLCRYIWLQRVSNHRENANYRANYDKINPMSNKNRLKFLLLYWWVSVFSSNRKKYYALIMNLKKQFIRMSYLKFAFSCVYLVTNILTIYLFYTHLYISLFILYFTHIRCRI